MYGKRFTKVCMGFRSLEAKLTTFPDPILLSDWWVEFKICEKKADVSCNRKKTFQKTKQNWFRSV